MAWSRVISREKQGVWDGICGKKSIERYISSVIASVAIDR